MQGDEKLTKEKVEETGGELTTVPNDKYAKFFAKFQEIDTLPTDQWKLAHLIGYFCQKYQSTYGVPYSWKFNNPNPNKCFEVWQMNTLIAKLSSNPKILKEYIDWAFNTLVPQAKRRLTSISFMTKDEVVNPYKINVLLNKRPSVDRASYLPEEYHKLLGQYFSTITTYGALAFAIQVEPRPAGLDDALERLTNAGFDLSILERIV